MKPPRILICDDEPDLRELVGEYLSLSNFEVELVADVAAMKQAVANDPPDMIILDVRMPGGDGLTALRALRTQSDVPVLMLTSMDGVIDRVVGLEMGADDYMGKPVDLRELEARVRAVLRRRETASAPTAAVTGKYRFGTWTLDVEGARLIDEERRDIGLTAMEFSLLKVFLEHRGRVLSRDQLLDLAHHGGWEPFDRSIDLRVSRLRRKIELDPTKPRFIKTLRGLGYVFNSD